MVQESLVFFSRISINQVKENCFTFQESYNVFESLLEPLIELRHPRFDVAKGHVSNMQLGDITDLKLDSEYVLSVRVRGVRNVHGYALPSHCTRAERKIVEQILMGCFSSFGDEFIGKS